MGSNRHAFAIAFFGLAGVLAPAAARADIPAEVLAAVEAPEVAEVSVGIATVLEDSDPLAEAQEIAANLHAYLSSTDYSDHIIHSALRVVLDGEWSSSQLQALRGLFSRYIPANVRAPSGGAEAAVDDRKSPASTGTAGISGGGAARLGLQQTGGGGDAPDSGSDSGSGDGTSGAGSVGGRQSSGSGGGEPQPLVPPLPPAPTGGGGSDYEL